MSTDEHDLAALRDFLWARACEQRREAAASCPPDQVALDVAEMLEAMVERSRRRDDRDPTNAMRWAATQWRDHVDFRPQWRWPGHRTAADRPTSAAEPGAGRSAP